MFVSLRFSYSNLIYFSSCIFFFCNSCPCLYALVGEIKLFTYLFIYLFIYKQAVLDAFDEKAEIVNNQRIDMAKLSKRGTVCADCTKDGLVLPGMLFVNRLFGKIIFENI